MKDNNLKEYLTNENITLFWRIIIIIINIICLVSVIVATIIYRD